MDNWLMTGGVSSIVNKFRPSRKSITANVDLLSQDVDRYRIHLYVLINLKSK